jgi:CheY-like chemotaxis protein
VITVRGLRGARETVATVFGPTPTAPSPIFEPQAPAAAGGVLFSRDRAGEVNRRLLNPVARIGEGEPLRWRADEPLTAPRKPLRVLLVEDDQSDIEVVKALLDPVGDVIDLRYAKTRKDGEAAARTDEPDLVLLDLGLPDSRGLQTVTQWHFNSVPAPVLVVSGEYGAEIVDRGRELGVTGFMDKAELADFLAAGDQGTSAFVDRLESAVTA